MEQRIKRRFYSFDFESTDTTIEAPITGVQGEVFKLVISIPEFTNTPTLVITMRNGGEKEIFKTQSLVHNEDYNITTCRGECLEVESSTARWIATLSETPGSSGTITLTTYTGE